MRQWTPLDLGSLQGWYRPSAIPDAIDGTLQATLPDASGNELHATATGTERATYVASGINGRPALLFDAEGQRYHSPISAENATETIRAVVEMLDTTTINSRGMVGMDSNGGGRSLTMDHDLAYWGMYFDAANWSLPDASWVYENPTDDEHTAPETPYILGWTARPDDTLTFYTNGEAEDSTVHEELGNPDYYADYFNAGNGFPAGHTTLIGAEAMYEGGGGLLDTSLYGYLGDVIITSGPVSAEEDARIDGYLAHEYGLTASLPSNHPYVLEPPIVPETPCPTCGNELDIRDTDGGAFTYVCENNHWFLLSPNYGWLVIPAPVNPKDPTATGVA